MVSEVLLAAVARANMIDLVGRILSNPARNAVRVSTAETVALAKATDGLWGIAIEAHVLLTALDQELLRDAGEEHRARILRQMGVLRNALAPLFDTNKQQEKSHGDR